MKRRDARRLRRGLWLGGLFFLMLAGRSGVAAQVDTKLDLPFSHEKAEHRLQIITESGLLTVRNRSTSLTITGLPVGLGAQVGLSDRWALGMGLHQAFSSSLSAVFTQIEVRGSFALTGKFGSTRSRVLLGSTEVFRAVAENPGGVRLSAFASQYLFNTSAAAIPYSGFGAGLFYELPLAHGVGLQLGARADLISNGADSLVPLRGVLGFLFSF